MVNTASTRVVNLRGWPGLENWKPPTAPPAYSHRLLERPSMVLVAAADLGAMPEQFGIGAYLETVGRSVLGGGIIVSEGLSGRNRHAVIRWARSHMLETTTGPRPWAVVTLRHFYDPLEGIFARRAYVGAGFVIGAELGRTFGLAAEHCGPRRGANAQSWQAWLPGWGRRHDDGRWKRRSPHRPCLYLTARRVGWQVEFGPVGTDSTGRPAGKLVDGRLWRGAFVDTLSLAYALDADRAASFAEHRENFGLPSLELPLTVSVDPRGAEILVQAVRGIHELALVLDERAAEWFTTAADRAETKGRLDLCRTSSPGVIAAQVPARLRARAPLDTFALSEAEHDHWAEAFHGGWVEA